jgi:cobalt-zinc-cadmium efflux system outer membrane protein
MKRIINRTIILSGLFLSLITTAQAQEKLTIDSVFARIRRNPALLSYDAKASAQDAYALGAKSLDAPKFSAGQYQTPYSANPNTGSFMLQAEQTFTNPAKLRAKEEYMKAMSKVTSEDKAYQRNQLFAQAKGYYYDRVILEKKLSLLKNTQSLLEYMLKDANIRLTYGKETLSNIYKAKAELYQLDNTREQFNNEIRQKNIMLNTLMNRDKNAAFEVDTNVVVHDYEAGLTDSAALASARSDIRSIDRNIQLQQLSANVENSKRKPDFGLQAAHMFSYGGYPSQYILMASVTIPIAPWSSREYKANLKGIRYEVEEMQQKRLDIINQTEGALAGLRADMSSKKRQLKNYNTNIIPAQQNAYKTALLAYEQNTGNLPAVLDAIRELQTSRMDALDRLQELVQLQVAYEKENERY